MTTAGVDLTGMGRNLQSHINMQTTGTGTPVYPHHPVVCQGPLYLTDKYCWCEHKKVPFLDERLQAAITVSICELLMEEARKL